MSSPLDAATSVPLAAPLPALPPADDFTPAQWAMFAAIADTIIPSLEVAGDSSLKSDDLRRRYYAEKPSDIPAFRELIRRFIFQVVPKDSSDQMRRVLNILGYSAGSLVLTGRTGSMPSQPRHVREEILLSWRRSRLGPLRLLESQLNFVIKQSWARTSPTLRGHVGVPRVPVDCRVATGAHEYSFLQMPPGGGELDEPEVIETDVVIVGSGCGGAVTARTLAEAGLRVLVVDKGYYWPPEYLPMDEDAGPNNLLMNGATDDGSVVLLAGETWGGGGTVNWSASLQLPGPVRREWAAAGLPFFASSAFQDSFDRVSAAMAVSTEGLRHSRPNQRLMAGCRRMGWRHAEVAQNCGGEDHHCGHCSLGCRSGAKKGPAQAWLPRAADAGATFIEGFDVTRVLFDSASSSGDKKATGVEGVWRSRASVASKPDATSTTRRVVVRASRVVVSAGTLQSPLVLLRSGLRGRHIGRNLHLHPVSLLGAVYDDDMDPWDGPIISSVCTEFEDLDGAGHGVKLETTSMMPWTWLAFVPWTTGAQYKHLAARMRQTAGFISVARDRHTGRVYPDPHDGRFRVAYTPSPLDRGHILEGLAALARINFEAGARDIFSTVPTLDVFSRNDGDDAEQTERAFDAWLAKLRALAFPSPETVFVAAHQMGSCRMSASPSAGVVDPSGRVWGTQGLYVVDASVFPSASGVNPFLTVMAVADALSRGIANEWTRARL